MFDKVDNTCILSKFIDSIGQKITFELLVSGRGASLDKDTVH